MSDPRIITAYESCRLEGLDSHQRDSIIRSVLDSDPAQQYFDIHSGRIYVRSHVGMVSFDDGTMLEILPNPDKMGIGECDPQAMRSLVLRMLRIYFGNHKESCRTPVDLRRAPILDVFIELFCESVEDLMARGIRSGYSLRQGNQRFIRGRILFPEDIRRNSIVRTGTYVEYSEYCHDRPENRLIKTCLHHLSGVTRNTPLRNRLRSLAGCFDDVPVSHDHRKDLRSCIHDRNLAHYGTVLGMCKVFLEGSTYSSFRGSTISTALLFNMNDLFEKYITNAVSSEAVRFGASVRINHDSGTRPRLYGDFALRPDIVVSKDGKVVIMDTKWKDLTAKASIDDAYQMFAYCKKYGASSAYLITSSDVRRKPYLDECGLELHLLRYDLMADDSSVFLDLFSREFESSDQYDTNHDRLSIHDVNLHPPL